LADAQRSAVVCALKDTATWSKAMNLLAAIERALGYITHYASLELHTPAPRE
jgi:hypothetical protein